MLGPVHVPRALSTTHGVSALFSTARLAKLAFAHYPLPIAHLPRGSESFLGTTFDVHVVVVLLF